ncbi:MAG: ribbon-helix-helix protein, CopG family [Acidobacteriota bacterium]|nr:ribbon-helix-helix protein, CopG family [Acidobacteriota bacterium]
MNTEISVKLPKRLVNRLDGIAREMEAPASDIVRKALESYLDEFSDLKIASDRLCDQTDPIVSSRELRKSCRESKERN